MSDLIHIHTVANRYIADLVKGLLESNGIKCLIEPANTSVSGGYAGSPSVAPGPWKIHVFKNKELEARKLLENFDKENKETSSEIKKNTVLNAQNKSNWSPFLIIIIFITIVGGGIFAWRYLSVQKTEELSASNYSFKAIENFSGGQYSDFYVEIYKNQELIKTLSIKDTLIKPSLFVLSPDKKYVAFKIGVYGGTCVYGAGPAVINLDDFSRVSLDSSDITRKLENALGIIDLYKATNYFSAIQEMRDIKWLSNNKIEASMQFGDETGCSINFANKPTNAPAAIELKIDFILNSEEIRISMPDINSFDLVNKTFEALDFERQKIKVLVSNSTKIYQTINFENPNWKDTYYAFPEFYSLIKNWSGPGWWFIVKGFSESENTIKADEIFYYVQ